MPGIIACGDSSLIELFLLQQENVFSDYMNDTNIQQGFLDKEGLL